MLSDCFEQRIVLHVARANLNAIGHFGHEVRAFVVHRLCYDGEAGFMACAELAGAVRALFFPRSLKCE